MLWTSLEQLLIVSYKAINLASCLRLQDGGVFTFGAGMYGQLGHNSTQSESLPRKVFELMGSEVTMLACGRLVSNHLTVGFVSNRGTMFELRLYSVDIVQ